GSAKSRREPKQPSLAGRHRTCDGCFYGGKATAEWDCALPSAALALVLVSPAQWQTRAGLSWVCSGDEPASVHGFLEFLYRHIARFCVDQRGGAEAKAMGDVECCGARSAQRHYLCEPCDGLGRNGGEHPAVVGGRVPVGP